MNDTLLLILLIVLIPYVLGPILVKLTLRVRSRPELELLAVEQLPPAAHEYFGQTAQGLMACRFTIISYLRVADQVPNVTGYVALWVNRPCGQFATAVAMFSKAGPGFKVQKYLEFLTKPVPGAAVLTNNTRELQSFKIDPRLKDVMSLPRVHDPAALYQVHLNREARLIRADAPRYMPPDGQETAFFSEAVARDIESQQSAGRLYNAAGDLHRPTLFGAIVMTYGQLFPIKQIRQLIRARRAKRELAESRPMPFPASVRLTEKPPFE